MSAGGDGRALRELVAGWRGDLLELPLLVFDRCDSTQDVARRLLDRMVGEEESPGKLLVVALEQSNGRGRRGRRWESPSGSGLWASLLLPVERGDLQSLPARIAVALAATLRTWVPTIRIKWPNDLVHEERKVGGILVEVVTRGEEGSWAIAGFGIDIGPGAVGPSGRSISLHEILGAERCPALADVLLACGERFLGDLRRSSAPGWLEEYRGLSAHALDDPLRVVLDEEELEGRFGGLDDSGALRLRLGEGERIVTSGDVFQW